MHFWSPLQTCHLTCLTLVRDERDWHRADEGVVRRLLLQELKGIEEQLKSAEESSGDMEVLDALIAKEKFYARIGAKAEAYKAADEVGAGCRAAKDGDAWQPVAPVRKFTHLQASWLDAGVAQASI